MIPDAYDYLIVCAAHEAAARAACTEKDADYVVVSTEPARCEWLRFQQEGIRALDSISLTRLAWEMKLDPRDSLGGRYFSWKKRHFGEAAIDANGDIWRPYECLSQADAVFRSLRMREWRTTVTATWRSGQCTAAWPYAPYQSVRCTWDGADHTEARAMLLCAVLAVVSRREIYHEC